MFRISLKRGAATLVVARRLCVVAAYAFWIGGLVFYGSVVIPIGSRVVGGHSVQGFVTQEVTRAVNLVSVPALTLLLWNMLAERRSVGRLPWRLLIATWGLMVTAQVVLFAMHPALSRTLDVPARAVADHAVFDPLHEAYVRVTGVQHLAALTHLWFVLLIWANARPFDRHPLKACDAMPRGTHAIEPDRP